MLARRRTVPLSHFRNGFTPGHSRTFFAVFACLLLSPASSAFTFMVGHELLFERCIVHFATLEPLAALEIYQILIRHSGNDDISGRDLIHIAGWQRRRSKCLIHLLIASCCSHINCAADIRTFPVILFCLLLDNASFGALLSIIIARKFLFPGQPSILYVCSVAAGTSSGGDTRMGFRSVAPLTLVHTFSLFNVLHASTPFRVVIVNSCKNCFVECLAMLAHMNVGERVVVGQ
mmetsp:Transcript_46504/g.140903  ORF Transcript_46504/g.140903 Transcript_46504/m.140903 type:complete len:233 (+) Transcript_46504:814-1512(+)